MLNAFLIYISNENLKYKHLTHYYVYKYHTFKDASAPTIKENYSPCNQFVSLCAVSGRRGQPD